MAHKHLLVDHHGVAVAALCEPHFTVDNRAAAEAQFAGSARHWTAAAESAAPVDCPVCQSG